MTFTFEKTGIPPLVIVDFRVQLWRILPLAQALFEQLGPDKIRKATPLSDWDILPQAIRKLYESMGPKNGREVHQYIKACWAILLSRGPDALSPSDYTVVVVDDNGASLGKPYWRVNALSAHFGKDYEGYKAGRAAKTDEFNLVAQIGLDYIKKEGLPYFTKPAYEADDWAGLMVYHRNAHLDFSKKLPPLAQREVLLYTVDTDWLQLAGRGVYWVNTGPWTPRVRGEIEACRYLVSKAKRSTLREMGPIKYANQIVRWKELEGDKADNLPPGSPRWSIDLIAQHPQFGLAYQRGISKYLKALNETKPNVKRSHVTESFNWIASRGYPLLFPHNDYLDNGWKE